MSVINKPDFKIFAQDAKSGEVETFPDVLRGWGIAQERTAGKPPMEWFNSLGKRVDEWLLYLTQRGLPEWDASVDYPKDALIQHASVYYVALKVSKSAQPNNSQTSWKKMSDFLGVDGKLAKDQNGADIPDKPKFIENLGLLELLKKKVDHAKYINDKANIPEAITSQGTGFYRTSATVTGTNIDSELGYSLFWAINLSGNIGALCVNRLGNLYFSNDCAKWERAASINDIKDFQKKGNYAVTDIDELAGNKAITSQIKGNLATSKKTNSPYPPDSPVGAAFKILQIGDDSWPSLLLFDSYTNKAFLATRKSTAGEFNPFLRFAMMDDVLGSGQSYIDVTSSRSLGSTYTNSTGRTIFVMVTISRTSGSSTADVKIDGINVGVGVSAVTGGTASNAVCFPVPANSKYSVSIRAGEVGLTWSELR